MASLFDHAGGEEPIHRLEASFYEKVLADPAMRRLFGERVPTHVDHLTWFTAESFGGPDRFTRELGFPYMVSVHRGLEITDEERERFVELYLEALEESDLPDDAPFREAFRAHLEFGSHVATQNSRAKDDSELNPLDEVPHWTWAGEDEAD
jgi:hemoglobin